MKSLAGVKSDSLLHAVLLWYIWTPHTTSSRARRRALGMPLLCNSGCGLVVGTLLTLCIYQGVGSGEASVGSGAGLLLGSSPCDCSTDWQELRNSWILFLLYLLRVRCVFNRFSAVRAHIQSWSRDVGWTAIFPASILWSQSGQGWFLIPVFNPTCAIWAFP